MRKKPPGNTSKTSASESPYILLAGADIGSNAMRVVLVSARRINKKWELKREQALRLPVRIGGDVFSGQPVTPETTQRLISAMWIYRELIDLYQPYAHRACATSALREAVNGEYVLQAVRKSCGIDIELIDGHTEARLIYHSLGDAPERPVAPRTLHIDVGGGSTELILGTRRRILELASFRNGTVRQLRGNCTSEEKRMRQWIREHTSEIDRLAMTASGGNARQLYKIIGSGRYIDLRKLRELASKLDSMSVRRRIQEFSLRPDRADTIVPAAQIYISVMLAAGHRHLYVPRINLIGGILQDLAKTLNPKTLNIKGASTSKKSHSRASLL